LHFFRSCSTSHPLLVPGRAKLLRLRLLRNMGKRRPGLPRPPKLLRAHPLDPAALPFTSPHPNLCKRTLKGVLN
jgi:hypothetical protein